MDAAAAGRLIHGSAPCYRKKHLETGPVRPSSEEDSALGLGHRLQNTQREVFYLFEFLLVSCSLTKLALLQLKEK